jgi:hypothetical protein
LAVEGEQIEIVGVPGGIEDHRHLGGLSLSEGLDDVLHRPAGADDGDVALGDRPGAAAAEEREKEPSAHDRSAP